MINKAMIFLISIIVIFSIFSSSSALTEKIDYQNRCITLNYDPDIFNLIDMVNETLVSNYLIDLVGFGPHPTGSENCTAVAEYLYDEFESLGIDVFFDNWKYPLIQGKNVVATINGTNNPNDEMYIVCAHYDTWPGSPGANDNGAGVAVVLSVANILSSYSFNNTIRFVLFSGHENGPLYTYGSFAYVKKAYQNGENIIGVINLDAVGSTGESGNALRLSKSTRADVFSKVTLDVAEKYFDQINIKVQVTEFDNIALDHQSFIDYGFEAITYIQADCLSVPCHCPEDNLDIIDFSFLTNVTKLTIATVATLGQKPVDLQVKIIKPEEAKIYIFNRAVAKTLSLNIRNTGLRGLTYILGRLTVEINITTDEEIFYVYFYVDNQVSIDGIKLEPPYEFTIKRNCVKPYLKSGKHKLSTIVTTKSGKIAYDEMDFYFI